MLTSECPGGGYGWEGGLEGCGPAERKRQGSVCQLVVTWVPSSQSNPKPQFAHLYQDCNNVHKNTANNNELHKHLLLLY